VFPPWDEVWSFLLTSPAVGNAQGLYFQGKMLWHTIAGEWAKALIMNTTERPTILLVDDDEDLLMMMRTSFERAGYRVVARKSAPAKDEVEQLGPSVIFMDVELQEDNGAALCHAIKRGGDHGDQHIILISGHAENTLSQEAMSALADGCIQKPFNMISLHEMAAFYTRVN